MVGIVERRSVCAIQLKVESAHTVGALPAGVCGIVEAGERAVSLCDETGKIFCCKRNCLVFGQIKKMDIHVKIVPLSETYHNKNLSKICDK